MNDIITQDQISSLERIAAIVAKSGMGGFKTPEQATAALLLAQAEGIPVGRVIHEYHVINGRLSLRSECMLARFQNAGGVIKYVERTDTCVSVNAAHPRGGSLSVTWTIERARKAGLTNNPTWQKHPTAMLSARAIAEAIRAVYPACLSGIITEAEAEELPAEPLQLLSNGNGHLPAPPPELKAPEPQPEALEPAPVDEPAPEPAEDAHPLDSHLAGLNQDKLNRFLLSQGMIQPGQNYRDCTPNAVSRILKQMPSFLKAAGFEEELVP